MKKKIVVTLITIITLIILSLPNVLTNSYATEEDDIKQVNGIEKEQNDVNLEESNIQTLNLSNEENQIIKDGIYRISMFGNSYCHMALEIENGSKKVEANVQLGNWFNKDNEKNKFQITYDQTSGYYTIQSINSGNMLDVQNGGMTSGTNVWQHKPNGTDAQKWKIEKNEDGSYSFVSKKNELYLNVENGNIKDGANIQVYEGNNKQEQKFQLISLDSKPERIIEDGIYKIALKADNNIVLQTQNSSRENGGNIETGKWVSGTSNNQRKFELTYNEDDGYYTIESVNAGKVFDAQNGGMTNGTNIWQYAGNYTDAQRWKIEKNEDGTYSFVCKKSGLYLDVAEGKSLEGQNIQIYEKTETDRQKFDLIPVSAKPEKTVEDGIYRISMFGNDYCHMSLEIENGSKQVEANVQLGVWINKDNEKNKFQITYDETSGYYTIQSINSGNMLDVQNGGMTNGTNVWQHRPNGTDAQKWIIEKNEDGSYSFVSKKNGLYLDGRDNNIQVYEGNNSIKQKFQFISLENIEERVVPDGVYKIETFSNSNQVIEVEGASSNNGANIKIGEWTEVANSQKKFRLTYNQDDGYYTIKAINSGKVFDAQNGGMTDGTNIWQYAGNYTDAQRWKIEKNSDGSYSFVCKKSGLYLNTKDDNVEISNKSETDAQKFNLVKTNIEYIDTGTYKIVVASNQDLAIDVNNASREKTANIVLGNTSDTIRNEFNIIPDENGYYVISSINSGNVLDVQNGGMTSGTNVWQHGSNGTDAQKWTIKYNTEDDTYSIISKKNGLYLDVQNGNINMGGNLQVCEGNNTKAQKFIFIKQEDKTEKYIVDNTYRVLTKLNEKIGFDIESASKTDDGILQIWTYERAPQQQFEITYQNGYYYIINKNSQKALQTIGNGINQYSCDYSNNDQKWILKPDGNYYNIISKTTGLSISIPDSNCSNGIDLKLSSNIGADNQLFYITELEVLRLETGYYGSSGLQVKGDYRGSSLKYYKIGNGQNVFFATFAVHGFEDSWNYDGQELTKIAENFKDRLIAMQDLNLSDKWTIYIFPSVNPDGEYHGYTNNGPGRTSLYSSAPQNKGIDINRCWSTQYYSLSGDRNYNGTAPFQSYEAAALREFLLSKRATNGQTVLVDLHGWLNETIGDEWIGSHYRSQFGMSKHIYTYGAGYLVNWARSNLGYNGITARSALIEMPEVTNSSQVAAYGFSDKYINATLNMLRSM